MKKLGLILPLAMLAAPALAEDVSETMDAHPNGHVSVSNVAGSIEVRGWSRDSVEVTGTLGDDVDELVFERDGKEIEIRVKVPKRMFGRKDVSSRLSIKVPEGSTLEVTGVSASIDVRDVKGDDIELQAVSGSIDADVYGGDIEIGTVSGSIDVQGNGARGDIELSSVSGSVSAEDLSGEITAESVSGRVSISGGTFESGDFETVNGSIIFKSGLEPGGDLAAESVNGSVTIDIPNALDAEYDLETFNGGIRNCFDKKAERTSRYAPGKRLNFTVGDGDANITVETLNGSVSVCAG